MKLKQMICCWLLTMPTMLWAQAIDDNTEQYAMRYLKDHFLMQKGEDINVIDTDIEWPEVIYHRQPQVLQRYMTKLMFGEEHTDIDQAYLHFIGRHGKQVVRAFKEIPDDRRFCYTTVTAKVLSYEPGRWISYWVESEAKPEKLSGTTAKKVKKYLTYDISRQQILETHQMIKQDMIQDGNAQPEFYDTILQPLTNEDADQLLGIHIEGAWLDEAGQQLAMHMVCTTTQREISYDISLPFNSNKYLTTGACRRLLAKKTNLLTPEYITASQTWQGDSVYKSAELMPELIGGQDALINYLSHITPPAKSQPGKVIISYIVDKNGKVQDPRVVAALTPELDRHAIGIVRNTPSYKPGRNGGKPACVRMYMPIYYK